MLLVHVFVSISLLNVVTRCFHFLQVTVSPRVYRERAVGIDREDARFAVGCGHPREDSQEGGVRPQTGVASL